MPLTLTFPALDLARGFQCQVKGTRREGTGCCPIINCHQLMSAGDRAGEFIFSRLPALISWALSTSGSWPRPLVYSIISIHTAPWRLYKFSCSGTQKGCL